MAAEENIDSRMRSVNLRGVDKENDLEPFRKSQIETRFIVAMEMAKYKCQQLFRDLHSCIPGFSWEPIYPIIY